MTGMVEIQNKREKEGEGSECGGEVDFSLVEAVDLSLERHVCHLDLEDAGDEFRPPRLERRQLCSQTRLLPYQTLVNMAAREPSRGPFRTCWFFRSRFTSVVTFFSSSSACSTLFALASFT